VQHLPELPFPAAFRDWKELELLLQEADLPKDFKFTHGICDSCHAQFIEEFESTSA
jgi:hypothetical protein